MVYDVSNSDTFSNVKRWLGEIDQNCDVVNRILGMFTSLSHPLGPDYLVCNFSLSHFSSALTSLLFSPVGNKNDDPNHKVVLTEDAQRFADQMGIQLYETSAKENINVEEMFMAITRMVLRTKKDQKERERGHPDNHIKLQKGTGHKGRKSKCC